MTPFTMTRFTRAALTRAIATALAASPLMLAPQLGTAQDVDLGNLGERGFRIDGIDAEDRAGFMGFGMAQSLKRAGFSVAGAGDVNGDGLADLIVGAFGAAPGGLEEAGQSYVVFSASLAPNAASYRVRNRSGDAQAQANPGGSTMVRRISSLEKPTAPG